MRKIAVFLAILLAGALLLLAYMYAVAGRDPVMRRASVVLPDWPEGFAPIRVVFLSDTHVGGPDMPPERLSHIVDQVNALDADVVLLGGDFVSDKRYSTKRYTGLEAAAPFAKLRARLGAYAVYGNHDHWRGLQDIRKGLDAAHVHVIENDAVSVGPLSLGGTDDAFTGHDNLDATVAAMRRHAGARILLSYSPDVVPSVPTDVTLILAGHTHCGQIRLPFVGAVSTMSKYGERFACGLSLDGAKRVITCAGLGTSILPLRLGAVPDLWVIIFGPAPRDHSHASPCSRTRVVAQACPPRTREGRSAAGRKSTASLTGGRCGPDAGGRGERGLSPAPTPSHSRCHYR